MVNLNSFETDLRIYFKKLTNGKLYFLKVDDKTLTCKFDEIRIRRSPMEDAIEIRLLFLPLNSNYAPVMCSFMLHEPFLTFEHIKRMFYEEITLALDPSLYYI